MLILGMVIAREAKISAGLMVRFSEDGNILDAISMATSYREGVPEESLV